jgi:RNA polymerase sigma-70 factor (ECF subfamily)
LPRGEPDSEVPWLQPYPDFELERIADASAGPERRYEMREAVRLAFMAAIQELPPRQRAALLLCDVVGWSAQEIASLLGGSVASINSVLQRARATMHSHYRSDRCAARASEHHALLDRYVRAWESTDLTALVELLKEDATYSMPPWRQWYQGRDAIAWFLGKVWKSYNGFRLIPTHANDQPAFALYARTNAAPGWNAHSLQVLSMGDEHISALTMFMKPLTQALFPAFRLPPALTQSNSR